MLETLRTNYDMKAHTRGDSRQAGTLTDDFVDRFAIVGTPERCIERLRALEGARPRQGGDQRRPAALQAGDAAVGRRLIAEQVLPAMRR